jgi:hypothetical protein
LSAYRPGGPYPVLIEHGEQGSAKTTTARILRELVDPSTAPVRSEPRDARDLMIAATNGWLICYDNLSHLQPWLSDALCRLSTGGGFSTRELYTDQDEVIFDAKWPSLLTGIEELATRGDLLDRSIIVYLPRIPEEKRQLEEELMREFYKARPRILGALLDAVSAALRNYEATRLERLPRMADFAKWVAAAEPALGWEPGSFLRAYGASRDMANEMTLDASPVTAALTTLTLPIMVTATELLATLDERADERTKRLKIWPKSGRALSNALRRIAPNLAANGIDVIFHKPARSTAGRRLVEIKAYPTQPESGRESSSPSTPSAPPETNAGNSSTFSASGGDGNGDDSVCRDGFASPPSMPKNPIKTKVGDGGDDGDANMQALSEDEAEEL